jgi:hypothetical protein
MTYTLASLRSRRARHFSRRCCRKNAKTNVCEVSSMSISDNITPLAIKARLHNNQKK